MILDQECCDLVTASLVEERVHLLVADLLEPRRADHVARLLADPVVSIEGGSDPHVRI